MAHARHGDISEIGGPSGAAEHLAHERERHHDENRHAEQRPDHAVDVESEIDQQAFGRGRAGRKVSRKVGTDENVDDKDPDDGDERCASGAATGPFDRFTASSACLRLVARSLGRT
jgi:hypothetical protein